MADRLSRGAHALLGFLKRYGITNVDAASALGVSDPTIHDWVTGAKLPRHEHRLRIERWTGEVHTGLWVSEDESKRIKAVVPFRPVAT